MIGVSSVHVDVGHAHGFHLSPVVLDLRGYLLAESHFLYGVDQEGLGLVFIHVGFALCYDREHTEDVADVIRDSHFNPLHLFVLLFTGLQCLAVEIEETFFLEALCYVLLTEQVVQCHDHLCLR